MSPDQSKIIGYDLDVTLPMGWGPCANFQLSLCIAPGKEQKAICKQAKRSPSLGPSNVLVINPYSNTFIAFIKTIPVCLLIISTVNPRRKEETGSPTQSVN